MIPVSDRQTYRPCSDTVELLFNLNRQYMKPTQLLTEVQSIFALSADDMARICKLGGADIPATHFTEAGATLEASGGAKSKQNGARVAEVANGAGSADADWCTEQQAIQFLNGFIAECRGPADKPPPVETTLNNNLIFRKIKIALGLQADDLLQMLADVEVALSKHELSALFRKADNKHYRVCSDELLEAFLNSVRINHYG